MTLLYLSLGGVLGTVGRYYLGGWVQAQVAGAFPWGTLAVNVLGSLLLGLAIRGVEIVPVTPDLRLALTIGFCGAFTTFSTFSLDILVLLEQGTWARAASYALGSLALGLAALAAGLSLAGPVLAALGKTA